MPPDAVFLSDPLAPLQLALQNELYVALIYSTAAIVAAALIRLGSKR